MRPLIAAFFMFAATSGSAQDMGAGQAAYLTYCATCHGDSGAGDGPLTAFLTIPVPDLRGLAARKGGEFPAVDVIYIIDGRLAMGAHGGPMPVFGALMQGEGGAVAGPDGSDVITKQIILDVTDYIAGLQHGE